MYICSVGRARNGSSRAIKRQAKPVFFIFAKDRPNSFYTYNIHLVCESMNHHPSYYPLHYVLPLSESLIDIAR